MDKKINCESVEVAKQQIICTGSSILLTYDLDRVQDLEVVYEGKSYHVQKFTAEDIKRINDINANKTNSKKAAEQERKEFENSITGKLTGGEKLSFASLPEFMLSLKVVTKNLFKSDLLTMVLMGAGLVLVLLANLFFLIAAFREGVIWGLSCLFLPFVSFFFLIAHWQVAFRSFFVGLFDLALLLAGVTLAPEQIERNQTARSQSVSSPAQKRVTQQKKADSRFTCSGKVYCREMTSCAEAKFYLRNCPGTKMDGNNDGVPCEKQWCR